MKNIVIGFLFSFAILTLIWFIVGFAEYGEDIVNKHLDLKNTVNEFTSSFDFSYGEFLNALKRFINVFDFNSYKNLDVLDAILKICEGMLIAPLETIWHFVGVGVSVIIAFFEFVFYPKFI